MSHHRGVRIGGADRYEVIDCEVCGWAHLDPIPDEAELALMYERAYYQEHNPGWLDKDRHEQPYWDLEHADKLDDWASGMGSGRPQQHAGTPPRLLDVGCSGGLLMEFAQARGWLVEGVEPSTEAVRDSRLHGLTVHAGLYGEVDLPPRSFDVVHSKLVGEHLPRPRHFLEWSVRLLRPGGIVSMHVPNDFNPLQLAARDALDKPDWWVAPPFHINYFSFASLERLLDSCGLVPFKRDATFPVEWFLLMGEDYVGDFELGALVHSRRMSLETRLEALGLRRPLHDHLAAHGLGREAIVHARLPE